jgi:uncharacterized protein
MPELPEQTRPDEEGVQEQLEKVREIIGQIGPMLVAYSGGVDSALLLKVAHDVLGNGATAVTAVSPSLPAAERRRAADLAREIGARHMEVTTRELDDPRYAANPSNRCYFCKAELFDKLREVGQRLGVRAIVYGANRDDLSDHRPGMSAAEESGIRAPLLEAGLGKGAIRQLSRHLGLPSWDRPARPCLSSRIPHGIEVTPDRLRQIEQAEEALEKAGFQQFRVRYHHDVARIEVGEEELGRLLEEPLRVRVVEAVRRAGFRHVAVDLAGYRTGSLNILD